MAITGGDDVREPTPELPANQSSGEPALARATVANGSTLVLVLYGLFALGGYSLDHPHRSSWLSEALEVLAIVCVLAAVGLVVANYATQWGARRRCAHLAARTLSPSAIVALVVAAALEFPGHVLDVFL
jgi:hypothetical protein